MEESFTDDVISRLSKLPGLRVNSLTMVSQYKKPPIDPKKIGVELGVDAVLVGRIEKRDNNAVMVVQLKSAADGSEIWSETYALSSPPFDLKETICNQVAAKLKVNSGAGTSAPARETNNKEAYLAYLRGDHYLRNRDIKGEGIKEAVNNFKEAIRLDPAYAEPHAGLADCYAVKNSPAYGVMSTDEAMQLAMAEAQQALQINPGLTQALTSLGTIYLKHERNWKEAENHFKRAIRAKPDYAKAHIGYADLLTITGRFDEAIREITLAKTFDPSSSLNRSAFCRQFYYTRDYDRAASCLNELLAMEPDSFSARHTLGFVLMRQGKFGEAVQTLQALPDTNKAWKLPALGYALGQDGRLPEAQEILNDVIEMQQQNLVPAFDVALVYLGMSNNDEAFKWLGKAYADKNASLIYLAVEPTFDSIRSDPRFNSLAARLNLPVAETSALARSK